MLRPHIFTRTRDWPSLTSAHPNWDGGPPKNFLSWKFKIWLKIQRIHVSKFGTNGDTITNFYPDDVPRARVQFLEGLLPKIWDGQKTVQIFSRFLTTFKSSLDTFDSNYCMNFVDRKSPLASFTKITMIIHVLMGYWHLLIDLGMSYQLSTSPDLHSVEKQRNVCQVSPYLM